MSFKTPLQSIVLLGDVPLGLPSGLTYPVTAEWQEQVRQRLAELDMNQSDLARAVGTTSAMISYLLKHGKQSRLVPAIHKALKWPAPDLPGDSVDSVHDSDPQKDALADVYDALSEEKRKLLLDLALSWAPGRKRP